jgi:hypothetical protein
MEKEKKKSSRAQKEDYKPVSRFRPNEDLPDDASEMDKAKAAAKKADAIERSALLKRLQEAQKSDDQFKKLPGKPDEKMQKKTLPGNPNEKPDFLDMDNDGNKTESMKQAAKDKKQK